MLKRIVCKFSGHIWKNDNGHYPVHGFRNTPYIDSYCERCGIRPIPKPEFNLPAYNEVYKHVQK